VANAEPETCEYNEGENDSVEPETLHGYIIGNRRVRREAVTLRQRPYA
jgi:hypothetical protein